MQNKALGIVETFGFIPAIESADAALKAAEVKLIACRYAGSGLVSIFVSGDISSVKAAVEAGRSAAAQIGEVVGTTVIGRTVPGLEALWAKRNAERCGPTAGGAEKTADQGVRDQSKTELLALGQMKVAELRRLARGLSPISLNRGEIKMARKKRLIEAIFKCGRKEKE